MKKVLIISYYWPPSGGSGVQRWLKFVKYLPEFDVIPIVYTPEGGELPVEDQSLIKEIPEECIVIKRKIWEPYTAYKRFVGRKKNSKMGAGFASETKNAGLLQKVAIWIRGNLFIPDARKFWIKPSIRFLKKYLKDNPVDCIISTGPPHSMHMIALGLKKTIDVKWIADFRDPWTNIDFYQDLKLSKWADRKHHRLERAVLSNADLVLSVGRTLNKELQELGAYKTKIITNGFDIEINEPSSVPNKFIVSHVGTLNKSRNPKNLWKVLGQFIRENEAFRQMFELRLIGQVDFNVKESIVENGLDSFTKIVSYIPHDQVVREQIGAYINLLIVNDTPNAKGILTGKVFEYLAAGRYILGIGPEDGDLAALLKETKSGETVGFENAEAINQELKNLFDKFRIGVPGPKTEGIQKYSRKNLTQELVSSINEIEV